MSFRFTYFCILFALIVNLHGKILVTAVNLLRATRCAGEITRVMRVDYFRLLYQTRLMLVNLVPTPCTATDPVDFDYFVWIFL